jgi:hypothetical protein
MPSMRRCDLVGVLSLVVTPCVVSAGACGEFKLADPVTMNPSGGEAGAFEGDADAPGSLRDSASSRPENDGGHKPPSDFACGSDTWTKPVKARPECAPRKVVVLDDEFGADTTGISIARTPAGRVAIAYNLEKSSENGIMKLLHFIPTSPSISPESIVREHGPYGHAGFRSRLAASAPDVVHVLAHDVDDVTGSGEVVVSRLTNGVPPLSSPELVVSAVAHPSELGFAVSPDGNDTFAVARMMTGGSGAETKASLAAFRKVSGESFKTLPPVATNLLTSAATGVGAASLRFDAVGKLHLVYQYAQFSNSSAPRYHVFDGSGWSYRKTVDNHVPTGTSGFDSVLAIDGPRKYVAYFFRRSGQLGAPVADLRLATWELPDDSPKVELLDQAIPSPDGRSPLYRLAMSVDAFGMVHLAMIRPTNETGEHGILEYRRQVRNESGGTEWIYDIVDDDVLSEGVETHMAMAVDDATRPHIAYISGKDRTVRYATRFDR